MLATLTVILAGQIVGIVGWTESWLAGAAPVELLVGGLAMQAAWGILLGWSLLRPAMRMAVLGASGVAMLIGNILQAVAGHVDGSMDFSALAANLAVGSAAVGLVTAAAWCAHHADHGRQALIGGCRA